MTTTAKSWHLLNFCVHKNHRLIQLHQKIIYYVIHSLIQWHLKIGLD